MYINGKETSSSALTSELSALLPTLEKKEVVVKADTDAKNSVVLQIMDAAQDAGYEKLIVAGEPLSKKQQNQLKNDSMSSDDVMQTSSPMDIDRTPVKRSSIPTDDEEWVE